jgi:hypothetical protein
MPYGLFGSWLKGFDVEIATWSQDHAAQIVIASKKLDYTKDKKE